MTEWMALAVGAVFVFALDQACAWMERRGWLYRPAAAGAKIGHRVFLPCPDCEYRVSVRALMCPACGRPLRPWRLATIGLGLALVAVSLFRLAEALPRLIGS